MTFQEENNINLTLETRTCDTCLVLSSGVDGLKTTHYCLQLAERFNHLHSSVPTDCTRSLQDKSGRTRENSG